MAQVKNRKLQGPMGRGYVRGGWGAVDADYMATRSMPFPRPDARVSRAAKALIMEVMAR